MEKEKHLPVLQVRLFGMEKITYGDIPVLYGRSNITQSMKLLLILLHSGKKGIARNRLLEALYGRKEMADSSNSLRVTSYRLKKMLMNSGLPEHEYVYIEEGIYYWDSPMETVVDTNVFVELLDEAETATGEKKIELLKNACQMYNGEFLQKLSGDEWVLMESIRYKNQYTKALKQLCKMLMEQHEYEEVLRMVVPACEMYPFEEWQAVKIDCYMAMNRYKDAIREYDRTAKMMFEELGISPSEKMLKQFKVMSQHISNRPQMIGEIKNNLREEKEEKGAFFCTFPSFRDAYRVIKRGMERNGMSVFLLLCTLTDNKGYPLEPSDKLTEMSNELYGAIKNTLRRCDSFTKYNSSQYLVMLMGTNEENCGIVMDRIANCFAREHKSWKNNLKYSVSSLYDLD